MKQNTCGIGSPPWHVCYAIYDLLLFSNNQSNIFNVWRKWELINRNHGADPVAIPAQDLCISGLCFRVAGNIDHPVRLQTAQCVQEVFAKSRSDRIQKDNIRSFSQMADESFFFGIHRDELDIADMVDLRIFLCITDGLRIDLHAQDKRCLSGS